MGHFFSSQSKKKKKLFLQWRFGGKNTRWFSFGWIFVITVVNELVLGIGLNVDTLSLQSIGTRKVPTKTQQTWEGTNTQNLYVPIIRWFSIRRVTGTYTAGTAIRSVAIGTVRRMIRIRPVSQNRIEINANTRKIHAYRRNVTLLGYLISDMYLCILDGGEPDEDQSSEASALLSLRLRLCWIWLNEPPRCGKVADFFSNENLPKRKESPFRMVGLIFHSTMCGIKIPHFNSKGQGQGEAYLWVH